MKTKSLYNVNGIVALAGRSDVAGKLKAAVQTMSHRAWNGYQYFDGRTWSRDGLSPGSTFGYAICQSSHEPPNDGQLPIHGEIYQDLEVKAQKEILKSQNDLPAIGEGAYVLVEGDSNSLSFLRDPLGTRPLFAGKSPNLIGVASERKALRVLGFPNVSVISPGRVQRIGFDNEQEKIMPRTLPKETSSPKAPSAPEEVIRLLQRSIKLRLEGIGKLGIAFSGGLDSSLLSCIASQYSEVLLISVFTRGSHDQIKARSAARILDFELVEMEVSKEELIKVGEKMICITEHDRTGDISIASILHLASCMARRERCERFFVGQLADELFGGYHRYISTLQRLGARATLSEMEADVQNAHSANFERDEAAISPCHELTLPYASLPLVTYCFSLPMEYKIDLESARRKILLRDAAQLAGVPEEIAMAPKKALQYSSGASKVFRKHLNPPPPRGLSL